LESLLRAAAMVFLRKEVLELVCWAFGECPALILASEPTSEEAKGLSDAGPSESYLTKTI